MTDTKANVIAIDGPSGSGKSTIAKIIADELGLTYLDTGAMFRAIAYILDQEKIDTSDGSKIASFLKTIKFDYQVDEELLIAINDENLTEKIREHDISKLASKYSQVTEVRDFLKEIQRSVSTQVPSILDGRDIGTVIFPDAILKIYLVADSKVRAKRRLDQLKDANPSQDYILEEILADIEKRDEADEKRDLAPLKKASDAIEINSTDLSVEEITRQVIELYHSRLN